MLRGGSEGHAEELTLARGRSRAGVVTAWASPQRVAMWREGENFESNASAAGKVQGWQGSSQKVAGWQGSNETNKYLGS